MVRATRIIKEEISTEIRYYISGVAAERIEDIVDGIRDHWQVENQLHWRLDVSFKEDQWRSKQVNAAVNMALINKIALNLLKKEKTAKVGVKNRRLMAA